MTVAEHVASGIDHVIASIPHPILLVHDREVVFANEPASALLGASAEQLRTGFRSGLHDDASRDAFDALLERTASAEPGTPVTAVTLRWASGPPLTTLLATAGRVEVEPIGQDTDDEAARRDLPFIVVLTDDTEVQRLDAVLTAYDNAVLITDADRTVTWTSRGMRDAYGDLMPLGSDSLKNIHPDDIEAMTQLTAESIGRPRQKVRGAARASHPDLPDMFWMIDVTAMNLLDDPAVSGLVNSFGPHADRPSKDDAPESNRLSDIMPVGIVQATNEGRVYYRNRLAGEQLGDVELGSTVLAWIERARDEDQEPLLRAMKDALAGNRSEPVVAAFERPVGTAYYRFEYTPLFDTGGHVAGWVQTSLDITAEVEANQEVERARAHLWHLANHDALTGLPNRPAVLERLEGALARQRRRADGVALLFCDLDSFKPVNDQHGHEAGDAVLCEVARRLLGAVRGSDAVGRLGGDEFVMLCESFDDVDDVRVVADRLRESIRVPITLPSEVDVTIDVSIGIAFAKADDTADRLIARADADMYSGKSRR
jgi:diguanylate cyclase (GGDEF)-like protein